MVDCTKNREIVCQKIRSAATEQLPKTVGIRLSTGTEVLRDEMGRGQWRNLRKNGTWPRLNWLRILRAKGTTKMISVPLVLDDGRMAITENWVILFYFILHSEYERQTVRSASQNNWLMQKTKQIHITDASLKEIFLLIQACLKSNGLHKIFTQWSCFFGFFNWRTTALQYCGGLLMIFLVF